MLRRGLPQDHEISRAPRLLEGGVGTTTGDLFGPLQPLLQRRERPMTEERGAPPALRHALLARDLPPQLAPMEPCRGVDPLRHLGSQAVMPDMVAVRLPSPVDDASLILPRWCSRCGDRPRLMSPWAFS